MRHVTIPAALRLALLTTLGVSGAAVAQNEATPLIPNLDGFSLPSSRPTTLPSPVSSPTPVPILPIASTPSPPPSSTATPQPQTPRATPTPRATATPTPRASASPPVDLAPTPTPTISPTPQAEPTAIPVPAPAATIPAADPDRTWLWLALGLAAVAAAGFALFRLRSRTRDEVEAEDVVEDAAEPVVVAPIPATPKPVPQPAPAPAQPTTRAQVDVEMRPIRAGTNLTGGAVDYEITLRNSGEVAANDVRVDIRLMNASVNQDAMLQALFAHFIEKPIVARFDLNPGQSLSLGGMAMLPNDMIAPLTIGDRPFFVPVFAVNILYRWGPTHHGQTAAAWVIGIEREPGAKMAPFRLDAGPRMYDTVGQRPQGLTIVR